MAGYVNIGDGRKVVASSATAERLVAAAQDCSQVIIQAETDNTGVIGVGSDATLAHAATARHGVFLTAGQAITIPVRDLQSIYIIASVNGDGVTYLYTTE